MQRPLLIIVLILYTVNCMGQRYHLKLYNPSVVNYKPNSFSAKLLKTSGHSHSPRRQFKMATKPQISLPVLLPHEHAVVTQGRDSTGFNKIPERAFTPASQLPVYYPSYNFVDEERPEHGVRHLQFMQGFFFGGTFVASFFARTEKATIAGASASVGALATSIIIKPKISRNDYGRTARLVGGFITPTVGSFILYLLLRNSLSRFGES